MNEQLPSVAHPEGDVQYVIYAVMITLLVGWFLYLKFGKTKGQNEYDGNERRAINFSVLDVQMKNLQSELNEFKRDTKEALSKLFDKLDKVMEK